MKLLTGFLFSSLLFGAFGAALHAQLKTSGPALGDYATILSPPPDPCVSSQIQLDPAPWPSQDFTVLETPARLFEAGPGGDAGDPPLRHDASARPLVLIVDGNGFSLNDYDYLAGYLAAKGFNVVVIDRPSDGGPDPVSQSLAAIAAAFETLGLPPDAPVAIIGHSMGGDIAIDTVLENHADAAGYDVRAVVLLAPKVPDGTSTLLSPEHVPALLAIYGSQDNDVSGLEGPLTDAFAAYDRAGTEASTTCHGTFCVYRPQMHRTMVYIHGADHSGLINHVPGYANSRSGWDPYNNYLARNDQFCIAKAYTLAMLEWTLDDNSAWKSMIHGAHVPASIDAMTTAAPDELGNPAGTPLRLGLQVSPRKRSVVENFEDGSWAIAVETPGIFRQLVAEGQFSGGDLNVRHATRLGLIAWSEQDDWQLLGFEVPFSKRDVTTFTHVAVRLGQLAGVGDQSVANEPNTHLTVLIGLHDGDSTGWESSHQYGDVLPADRRPNGQHQSVMSTLKIPLSAFSGLDKSTIETVLLALPAGTRGTLMIDSLEWVKE